MFMIYSKFLYYSFTTTRLTKLEFLDLDINGDNYLLWVFDAEIHLDAINLGETIKEGNTISSQEKAKP